VIHELVASLVSKGLARAVERAEDLGIADSFTLSTQSPPPILSTQSPPPIHQQLQIQRYCGAEPATATLMRASRPDTFQPAGNTGWELREDVPEKPGWLFKTPRGEAGSSLERTALETIWFAMESSAMPQLEVNVLKTY
jgi:hypothetical protein